MHGFSLSDWLVEYKQVFKIQASSVDNDAKNRAFARLNWIYVDGLIKTLQKMKENNRTASVSTRKYNANYWFLVLLIVSKYFPATIRSIIFAKF